MCVWAILRFYLFIHCRQLIKASLQDTTIVDASTMGTNLVYEEHNRQFPRHYLTVGNHGVLPIYQRLEGGTALVLLILTIF